MKLKSFFQSFEELDDYKQLEIKQKLLAKELLKPSRSQYLVGSLLPSGFWLQSSLLPDIICNGKCATSSQFQITTVICLAIVFAIYFFASWIQKNEERKKLEIIKQLLRSTTETI